jgi:phospholipase C
MLAAGLLSAAALCTGAATPALAAPAAASSSTLTESASSVPNGGTITFSYSTPAATVSSTNWIGIYESGQTPGQVGSTTWQYAPGASGTLTFSTASLVGVGSYTAYYLYNNGYQVLAGPVTFSVTQSSSSTLTESASSVPNGGTITFSYSTPAATVSSTNWIGIYESGQTPGQVGSTTWQYAPGASGTLTFSTANLDGVGSYTAYYLYNNEYQVLAAPVTFSVVPSKPAPAPVFRYAFGGRGPGALVDPFGVAAGPDGNVWVADRATSRVEEFTAYGRLVTGFGGPGVLNDPDGIAVGPNGDVWVSDTGSDRVVEFSPSGTQLAAFGSAGSGNGQLDQPQDLAVAPDGDVYVADQGNNRVEEFSASGAYLASIAVATPYGVALDAAGDIWVSSPSYADGNAVYEFAPSGTQLLTFGATQASYGALSNPGGIAVGPDGRIYVAQPDYGWVTVFNADGTFYTEFGLQQDPRQAFEDLAFPQDLAVTAQGDVWVADSGNGRIAEFGPAGWSRSPAAAAVPASGPLRRAAWFALLALAAGLLSLAGLRLLRRRPAATGAVRGAGAGLGQAGPAGGGLLVSRRGLLAGATALGGISVGAAVLPVSLRKAMTESLRSAPQGSINDIEHIVILMQENRSFDHYYGTMPGVRGYDDPTAIKLPNGNLVYYQPDPSHAQGYLSPFYYDPSKTSSQATPGTDHTWPTQHQAWDDGKMDQWIAAKGPYTMGYFKQQDIQFHWALAEAFTICDNYHCSVFGPTNPNRLYMWTGMIDPYGTGGGPIIDNSPAYNNIILSWRTYPELLEKAGLSWKVYQEEDNYDDNALAWFKQYGYAPRTSPLYQRGMVKQVAGTFENDAFTGRLPQVSWIVAPTAQTEHPDYFPAAGAEYIAQKLDAIAANPRVWAKTAFILCYDENDGMFDHVPPPTAPAGTPAEFVDGLPIGLGFRTPTTIVSPWTAGGFVCSDVFDHGSLIRFIEARFGVFEPNISAWRRSTCGDLTSAFRFAAPPARYPRNNTRLRLAAAEAALLTAQQEVNDNPAPVPPAVNEPLPKQ